MRIYLCTFENTYFFLAQVLAKIMVIITSNSVAAINRPRPMASMKTKRAPNKIKQDSMIRRKRLMCIYLAKKKIKNTGF